jgi:ribonuclease P protein component
MANGSTLGKLERVKKRKMIEEIFDSGESFLISPFKVFYISKSVSIQERIIGHEKREVDSSLQFGVAVSKKNFKKAVDRNRIKRLVREAYRTQKGELKKSLDDKGDQSLSLFIVYIGKQMPEFTVVKEKVSAILRRLAKKMM